jgi:hypothetical protein
LLITINCFISANDIAATVALDGFGDVFRTIDRGSVSDIVVAVASRAGTIYVRSYLCLGFNSQVDVVVTAPDSL